jgi:hypothetical protein
VSDIGQGDGPLTTGHVGFTGTRKGMTDAQKATVAELMDLMVYEARCAGIEFEVHHGDCVGADGDFHDICHGQVPVVIHPPKDPKLRAWCDGDVLPEKPYLERNRDIVDVCDVLIATPAEDTPQHSGGTWYTILYARRIKKRNVVVWPDGKVVERDYIGGDA